MGGGNAVGGGGRSGAGALERERGGFMGWIGTGLVWLVWLIDTGEGEEKRGGFVGLGVRESERKSFVLKPT